MADFARLPTPMPKPPAEAVFAGLASRIEGDTAPYLAVDLEPAQTVLFDATSLLWKEATVVLGRTKDSDTVTARGPGRMGFARGLGGAIFPIPLPPAGMVQIQQGHALLASGATMVRERMQGLGDRLSGSAGFMIERFTAGADGGVVWVQARGAVFERGLMEGEILDLHAGALLCKDPEVALETLFPSHDSEGRFELPCLRFMGPGRVAFDTITASPAELAAMAASSEPTRSHGLRGVFTRKQG